MDQLPILAAVEINEWLFEVIQPHLKGKVLEIDSNLNSISTIFIQKGQSIHLSTADKAHREQLASHYQGTQTVQKIHSINIHRTNFQQVYPAMVFDTILILNPMETGAFDRQVIDNARHLLRERGRLILLAPIFTALYTGLKMDSEELKTYNRRALQQLLTGKMDLLMTRYFNLAETAGYDRSGSTVILVARKI